MNGTKVWWQTKSVWGSVVALAAGLATLAGVNLDATLQDQLAELITGAATIAGGLLAWVGRARTQGALTWSAKP